MKNYDNLRLRPSEFGKVVSGLDKPNLTDNQSKTLAELMAKDKRTEVQERTLCELLAKQEAMPELSAGAKTYIREMVEADVYNYVDRIENKYFDKGIAMEQTAIDFLNTSYFESYTKFEAGAYANEFLVSNGCDIKSGRVIRDVKCSWSKKTHPKTFQQAYEVNYEWQLRCYMMLFDCDVAYVDHILVNTPEHLIKFEDPSLHIMDNLTIEQRHTSLKFERDLKLEKTIELAVKLCREFANEYLNEMSNNKNY